MTSVLISKYLSSVCKLLCCILSVVTNTCQKSHKYLHFHWFCRKCWLIAHRQLLSCPDPREALVYFHGSGKEKFPTPSYRALMIQHFSRPVIFPAPRLLMLHLIVTSVLADSLEMWGMALDAGDDVVKPLSKPEPPQAPATSVLKNEMETWNRTPQSLCHQNPQAKSGPWHLQTYHLNQHITGSKVF